MDEEFYATLVELARLGSVGVGVVVFLMVFLLLIRGKPVDEASARLREKFLVWGTVFAAFTAVVALVAPLIQGGGAGPLSLRLSFSPDLAEQSLSQPKVQLPDGSLTRPDEKFALAPATGTQVVTVRMDKTLDEVRNLRTATKALAESVKSVQDQRDALAVRIEPQAAPPGAIQGLEQKSQQSEALQTAVVESLNEGNFDRASILSKQLQRSVITTRPTVDAIAGRPQ